MYLWVVTSHSLVYEPLSPMERIPHHKAPSRLTVKRQVGHGFRVCTGRALTSAHAAEVSRARPPED